MDRPSATSQLPVRTEPVLFSAFAVAGPIVRPDNLSVPMRLVAMSSVEIIVSTGICSGDARQQG
jgi:hypothetical protein